MYQITSKQFKDAVALDPAWAAKLTDPVEITDYCDMTGSKITHLSPLLHFTGKNKEGKVANFAGCGKLEDIRANFHGGSELPPSEHYFPEKPVPLLHKPKNGTWPQPNTPADEYLHQIRLTIKDAVALKLRKDELTTAMRNQFGVHLEKLPQSTQEAIATQFKNDWKSMHNSLPTIMPVSVQYTRLTAKEAADLTLLLNIESQERDYPAEELDRLNNNVGHFIKRGLGPNKDIGGIRIDVFRGNKDRKELINASVNHWKSWEDRIKKEFPRKQFVTRGVQPNLPE